MHHQTSSDTRLPFGTTSQSVILHHRCTREALSLAPLEALPRTTASIPSGQITIMTLYQVKFTYHIRILCMVLKPCGIDSDFEMGHAHICSTHLGTCTLSCPHFCKILYYVLCSICAKKSILLCYCAIHRNVLIPQKKVHCLV